MNPEKVLARATGLKLPAQALVRGMEDQTSIPNRPSLLAVNEGQPTQGPVDIRLQQPRFTAVARMPDRAEPSGSVKPGHPAGVIVEEGQCAESVVRVGACGGPTHAPIAGFNDDPAS